MNFGHSKFRIELWALVFQVHDLLENASNWCMIARSPKVKMNIQQYIEFFIYFFNLSLKYIHFIFIFYIELIIICLNLPYSLINNDASIFAISGCTEYCHLI